MNLTAIQQAVRDQASVDIVTDDGTYSGVPRIQWKKREIVLKQANGCKTTLSFDDIPGF